MDNSQIQRLDSQFQQTLAIWTFHRNVNFWVGRPGTADALETGQADDPRSTIVIQPRGPNNLHP
jgi:hypothetical protein